VSVLHMRPRAHRSAHALSSCLLLTGLLAGPLASSASADTVEGSRSEKLREKAHVIDIRIDRGSAKLVVRRTFFNGGSRHDQATVFLDMPSTSVATGLRTLGMKDDKPFWFVGELMEAEAAAAKYKELTGIGGYYPKDPALLSWRSQDLLALQVFPCPPQQPKTVEYTLEMPTSYEGGKYHIVLPKMGTEALSASAIISPARDRDALYLDNKRVPPGTSFTLNKDEIDIAVEPRGAEPLAGGLSSVSFAKDRALVQFHIEAAPKLSTVPRGAHIAVVIDASRSIPTQVLSAELKAARAYLSHFEDAKVEVLTFDREVREAHGGALVPVRRAMADLEQMSIEPRNGSRVDAAIARADAILSASPAQTPKRIVLMTDLLTRASLTPAHVKGIVKSGALVHVGVVSSGTPELFRHEDDDPWAALPRETGGVLWSAFLSEDAGDAKEMSKALEEWARPVRIHKAKVVVLGAKAEGHEMNDVLDEGASIEHAEIRKDAITKIELTGELWASPIKKALAPSDAEARLSAALVFGSPLLHKLEEPEMMTLATLGRAVSPVTSYLAIEPGVRPSTEGLEWGNMIGSAFGAGGMGLAGIGRASGGRPADLQGFLKEKLSDALRTCGGGSRGATVELETTLAEIVDVTRVAIGAPRDAAVESCFTNAIWDLQLPRMFSLSQHTFTIVF
jgi:hypothetical protein